MNDQKKVSLAENKIHLFYSAEKNVMLNLKYLDCSNKKSMHLIRFLLMYVCVHLSTRLHAEKLHCHLNH